MAANPEKSAGNKDLLPPSPWRKSKAKAYLRSLFLDESSWIHLVTADEAHAMDAQFQRYPLKNFKPNYKSLQASMIVEHDAIAFDQLAFDAEKVAIPRRPATERGHLFWDGHPAVNLLAKDVKEGRSKGKKPRQLREERSEYKDFPERVFREHKYQEERKQSAKVYWQKKRNDDSQKKHDKEVRKQQRLAEGS
jgi:hypothetical protein